MKTYNIANISGLKLAINCETQQTAKKVLETMGDDFAVHGTWTVSTPVLAKHATERAAQWNTFHFAKERSYRIITDAIFLADNEVPQIDYKSICEELQRRLESGRNYLMGTMENEITVEGALAAFGWLENGLDA